MLWQVKLLSKRCLALHAEALYLKALIWCLPTIIQLVLQRLLKKWEAQRCKIPISSLWCWIIMRPPQLPRWQHSIRQSVILLKNRALNGFMMPEMEYAIR